MPSHLIRGRGGMIFVLPATTYKNPISYYLNLFTSQYRLSPRLNAWQAALCKPIDDLTTTISTFVAAFDLDSAVGAELDYLGQLIGQGRQVSFQPSAGVSPILDDATYRTLLYATIARNNWDGTTASLYPIWNFLFPNGVLIINDNQDMTATILVSGVFTSIQMDLITHGLIVPRPEGVLYSFSAGSEPYLGFDLNTSTVAGFDTGHFA